MRKLFLSALAVLLCVSAADAGRFRNHRCSGGQCYQQATFEQPPVQTASTAVTYEDAADGEATEALGEVNAQRAARGLRPYIFDRALTAAAKACAKFRAARLIQGHTSNDFSFLPSGSSAGAAGCAAWPPELGWGSCCTFESWTYAGAAWSMGRDGRRHMHLFVK